jgi:hypothetical protein
MDSIVKYITEKGDIKSMQHAQFCTLISLKCAVTDKHPQGVTRIWQYRALPKPWRVPGGKGVKALLAEYLFDSNCTSGG